MLNGMISSENKYYVPVVSSIRIVSDGDEKTEEVKRSKIMVMEDMEIVMGIDMVDMVDM